MGICQHLESEGQIFSTINEWTFFPTELEMPSQFYDAIIKYIRYDDTEWGTPFHDIKNFLNSK